MRAFFWVVLSLWSCASMADTPLQTVGNLDLARYQGTWYELARKPLFFQRKCVASQAQYRLNPDASVAVHNSCTTAKGQTINATGTATPQVAGQNDKLWVVFDNWFSRLLPTVSRGQYWVLYIDSNYQHVLVGEPGRKYLWLLAREPHVAPEVTEQLLDIARKQGYQLDDLVWRQ